MIGNVLEDLGLGFSQVELTPLVIFNFSVMALFTVCYFYQIVFLFRGLFRGEVRLPKAREKHRYAFFIAAHNEEAVIGNLVRSILAEDYPRELIDVYVVCDACTDDTHGEAERAGAITWDRNDLSRKGKSWVMDWGMRRILRERPGYYDAFVVFDADNVVSPDYIDLMNDAFDAGYLVCTSYRNSKNFDSSWISAAYATWFLREARFLNNARMMSGTSCAISGSGWMVAAAIIEGMDGWNYHLLTEDIQFSTFCAANGIQIGYVPAEFFDEQPLTLKASITQRLRWSKGFFQVFFGYCKNLLRGIRGGSFASYDLMMTIAPGILLTILSTFVNGTYLVLGWLSHGFLTTPREMDMCIGSLVMTFLSMYAVFFVLGAITTVTERRHIHSKRASRVVSNLFTFPVFMMTYIPITIVALFKKVEWVPTKHDIAVSFEDVVFADEGSGK